MYNYRVALSFKLPEGSLDSIVKMVILNVSKSFGLRL